MNGKFLIAAAISVLLPQGVWGQVTRPTTTTSQQVADEDLAGIQLRMVPAVLDARERRQDWHEAALQAESRVADPKLRDQLVQRLSGVAPYVARTLVKHPQDDALVSVLVYRQRGAEGKQAMVAVTFDGLGSELAGSFFADVLADWPRTPQIKDVPNGLVLDSDASSYLIFFLGKHGLEAGDIPHAKLKQSIVVAVNQQREKLAREDELARRQDEAKQRESLARQEQTEEDAAQAAAASQGPTIIPTYPDTNYPYMNDGFYYPEVGVPIIILPGEDLGRAEWRERARRREEELERKHRQHVQEQQNGQPQSSGQNSSRGEGAAPPRAGAPGRPPRTGSPPPGTPRAGQPAPRQPEPRQTPPARQSPPPREAPAREAPAREAPAERPAPPPAQREAPAGQQSPPAPARGADSPPARR